MRCGPTAGRFFRRLDPVDPEVVELWEWTRIADDLTAERTRLVNRVRQQLWRNGRDLGFGTWSSLIGTVRRACLLSADERTSLLPASLAVGHGRPSDDTKRNK